MRYHLMLFAFLMLAVAPTAAQATENRMTVHDIHSFITNTNSAINSPSISVTRNFLNSVTAENAVFENNISVYNAAYPWVNASWYGNPAYSAYYRYPMNPYYAQASHRALNKWDNINLLEQKKRMIPGYQAHMTVTNTTIHPYGQAAVADRDLQEYSMAYTPAHPSLATKVMHANSKCKAYLRKRGDEILLNRLDCNTNTSLPF